MEELIKIDLVAFVDGKLDCAGVAAKVEQYSEAITSLRNNDTLSKSAKDLYNLLQLAASDLSLRKDKAFVGKII